MLRRRETTPHVVVIERGRKEVRRVRRPSKTSAQDLAALARLGSELGGRKGETIRVEPEE